MTSTYVPPIAEQRFLLRHIAGLDQLAGHNLSRPDEAVLMPRHGQGMKGACHAVLLAMVILLAAAGCGRGDEAAPEGSDEITGSSTRPPAALAACGTCHSMASGEPHRTGPNLHGVFRRKAGSAHGYAYSRALSESGIVWSRENLDRFLASPTAMVRGTKMTAATGDAERRREIIAYLETL